MEDNKKINIDLGFFTVLTLIFITLKLCKVINWSWVWVLAPVWIPVGLIIFIIGIYIIVMKVKRCHNDKNKSD